jgi:vitamin B12 transporter
MRTPLCLSAALLALPAPVLAQDQAPDDDIVVTGQGLDPSPLLGAYSVTVLTRERAAASASGRLEDVLGSVAGFQQFRRSDSRSANPSAQGATLRGLGGNASSRTLVVLDGVPVSDPFFGYVPFSALPFERLAQASVIRGGGSGAFGAGAVAGTVELTSARPGDLPLAEAAAALNDRGESELSAALAPQLGEGFAVASARWDRGQGFWTTPTAQRVPASARAGYESWSVALRGVAPLTGDVELQARALLFDDHRTLRFTGADSTSSGRDASLRLVGRGDWQFDVLGYVQARDFSNIVISSTSFRKTLDQRATPSTGLGGKLELRPPLGEGHPLRLGVDWRRASGETREEAYNPAGSVTARRRIGGTNSDLGFFAEGDHDLGALRLTASARVDRWTVRDGHFREANNAGTVTRDDRFPNRSGWAASLRGGALFEVSEGLTMRASAYSGLRQPTLNELYRRFVVFPVITEANAALANEKLRGFEAGVDLKFASGLEIQLTAFDNKVKNAIANVTIAANLRQRQNVAAVHSRGIEALAKAKLGQFAWDASLALLDAEVEGSGVSANLDGKRPAQVPKFAASTTLAWRPAEGWLLAATLRHTGMQFEDDLETDRLPATTTLDAVATVPLGRRVSAVLRGENLTGETIITRNQGGSLDLGVPRTLWAGLRISIGR